MPGIHKFQYSFTVSVFGSIQETILIQTEDPLKLENIKLMFKIKNIESQGKNMAFHCMLCCKVGLIIPRSPQKNIWAMSAQRFANDLTTSPGNLFQGLSLLLESVL